MPRLPLRRLAYTVALRVFRLLPPAVRRGVVRAGTPGYTVGAVALLEHEGAVLALRQPHRPGWSLPGGLLDRDEPPALGVARELAEETGLAVEVGVPLTVAVNARLRRVDVLYRVLLTRRPHVVPGGEALEARWMTPDELAADSDGPTHEILDLFTRALEPSGTHGRVVDEAR